MIKSIEFEKNGEHYDLRLQDIPGKTLKVRVYVNAMFKGILEKEPNESKENLILSKYEMIINTPQKEGLK